MISLRDVRFYARHGVFSQETTVGNEFRVNLNVEISAEKFNSEADDLDSTLSYADLYAVVREEMLHPARLLETVCAKIGLRLRREFPKIQRGDIEIIKIAPPIAGIDGIAGVKHFF